MPSKSGPQNIWTNKNGLDLKPQDFSSRMDFAVVQAIVRKTFHLSSVYLDTKRNVTQDSFPDSRTQDVLLCITKLLILAYKRK